MDEHVQLIANRSDRMDYEVRFSQPEEDGTFEGVAVRFNTVDSYRTTFDPQALRWKGRSLPLLWSHDASQVIGSVRSITADREGLRIKARLNLDVARAREVRSMLVAGDISGLSIGFRNARHRPAGGGVRHIVSADLREISVVALPSIPGTGVTSIRAAPSLDALHRSIRATLQSLKG